MHRSFNNRVSSLVVSEAFGVPASLKVCNSLFYVSLTIDPSLLSASLLEPQSSRTHISSTHFACAPLHHLSRVRTRANTQAHTSTHTKNIKLANCNSNSCYTYTKGSFFINVSRALRFKTGECFTTKATHE